MSSLLTNLFKTSKTPAELVRSTLKHIALLTEKKDEKEVKASTEKLSQNLSGMKVMMYGDGEHEAKQENIDALVAEIFKCDIMLQLLLNIRRFEFEARKDVAQIFMFLLRRGKQNQAVDYVLAHPEIAQILVQGYDDPELALNCGQILRECLRHEVLCSHLLSDAQLFDPFFQYVQKMNFDVASDAFATFKLLLTKHKSLASKFLEDNYAHVFSQYNSLLQSENYVTKRQSLKLLSEVILDRSNFSIMMRYINDPENLKIMMNLLRGPSRAVQYEAFHVFKVFVANPNKSKPVLEILQRNQAKLIEFLEKFHTDKENEQFTEEKQLLLATLTALPPLASSSAISASSPASGSVAGEPLEFAPLPLEPGTAGSLDVSAGAPLEDYPPLDTEPPEQNL